MARPRTADRVYLVAVVALAVLFAANVLSLAVGPSSAPATTAPAGSAGKPRDVDMDALRRMLREGRLSTHEALHAKPVPAGGEDAKDQ